MTERKPTKGTPAIPTRTPGKREIGIFDNLRKPTALHPMEEILHLPPPIERPGTGGDLQPVVISRQYTKTLNWYYDDLARTLTSAQQSVFAQIYRLTIGHNRATCLISIPKLAERCGFEETAVRRGLKGLEARGLVHRLKEDTKNPDRSLRGVTFQIVIPPGTPGIEPPGGESQPGGEKQAGGKKLPMKEISKDMHETAPDAAAPAPLLSILRKIAESYRNSHTDATDEDVDDRLRDWFRSEAREVDEVAISAALKG